MSNRPAKGDFGEVLYNLNEAGDKSREAEEIADDLASVPPYLNADATPRERGVQLSEEAAEHRRRAEDALNRILDPLRARIAYLESLHVPQNVGAVTKSVFFDTGSAALGDDDRATLDEVRPISSANIRSRPWTSPVTPIPQGSLEANRALAQRRAQAVAAGPARPGGAAVGDCFCPGGGRARRGRRWPRRNRNNRRVDVLVAPHGTYNKGQ